MDFLYGHCYRHILVHPLGQVNLEGALGQYRHILVVTGLGVAELHAELLFALHRDLHLPEAAVAGCLDSAVEGKTEEQHTLATLHAYLKNDVSFAQFLVFKPLEEAAVQGIVIGINPWLQAAKLDDSVVLSLHFSPILSLQRYNFFPTYKG